MMVDLGSYPKLFHDKMTDPGVRTGSLTQRLRAWIWVSACLGGILAIATFYAG